MSACREAWVRVPSMIQGVMVHLLGSRSGYTTLGQSSALPGGVRSALEHLDFGSLSREQDIASLDASPMALGQCVAGSWMVMSRVLAGGRDDVGRLTIEKVSIIVPLKDWQSSVQDVRALVHDRGLWTRARAAALAGGTITVEAAPLRQSPLQATVAVVLDRWFKAVDAAGCVVVRADDEAVFKVLQSISPVDAARLSWGLACTVCRPLCRCVPSCLPFPPLRAGRSSRSSPASDRSRARSRRHWLHA